MASSDGFLTNGQLNKHELATENSPPLFADLDIKSPNRREWCCKHIQVSMFILVSKAMDRNHKEKEKEKASMLLYGLYSVVVSPDQIKVGFIKLLEWLRVSSYLSAPHHAELVENKWGGSIRCSSCQMAKGFSRVDQDAFKGGSDRIGGDLPRYKKDTVTIIQEYFLSDDIPELIRSLENLGSLEYNSVFLKKLITLAMDRKNKEKEMSSVLLSALHMEMFSTEDFINGFIMLLESAEDTASDELSLFLARAVIGDDVLAPVNLEKISSSLPPKSTGSETIRSARSLISAGERLLRSWGGGTG
ncbi:hypothetical protein F2Q69_00005590 [Brassica cretica]|uniref:MI domain-containing protein n=1 Tax=Brassica cretica TaxID=69181 RepID=A0A8S9PJ61_BRACR|nr:hypothetical protein F2Q69_00005590 [Brassica cretica]